MQKDNIKGCLFGYAIGDALGLGAEFMSRQEVSVRYPDGLTTYDQIIRDSHRCQWERGDYTNDTTQVLLMIDSIISKGDNDPIDVARRLKNWFDENHPIDISSNLRWVLSHPGYLEDPSATALTVFKNHHSNISRNDALGRALTMGLWPKFDERKVIENMSITHSHPMTLACAVGIARLANDILWHDRITDFNTFHEISDRYNGGMKLFIQIAEGGSIDELMLDDIDSCTSAAKTFAATVWAINRFNNPEETLYNMVKQGGDTDSICALITGLSGLRYGFDALPQHLVEGLRNFDKVNDASERLIPIIISSAKNESMD